MFGISKRLNQQFITTRGSVMFETSVQERDRLKRELKQAESELNDALQGQGLSLRRPSKKTLRPRIIRDVLAFGAGYAVNGLMKK